MEEPSVVFTPQDKSAEPELGHSRIPVYEDNIERGVGPAIGADLTLLPAMFARRMAQISPNGGQGFGLWSLVSKFTLAFAAAVLLPLLEWSGFSAGAGTQPDSALPTLTALYAILPIVLKLVSMGLLARINLETQR